MAGLKKELLQVKKERDFLKEAPVSSRNQSEIPHDSALSRGLLGINDVSSA
jgi:hypothetical protein